MHQLLRGYALAVLADTSAGAEDGSVDDDLNAVAHLVSRTGALATTITDFGVPVAARRAVLEELLGARIARPALRIVLRAVETERADELPTVLHDLYELARHLRELSPQSFQAQETVVSRTGWRHFMAGYADAVLEVVDATSELEEIEDELFRFARVVESTPALRSALSDTSRPVEVRQEVLGDLLAPKVAPATLRLARLSVQGRVRDLVSSLDWLVERTAWARGWRVARVRAAMPLDDGARQDLSEALGRMTHRPVELQITSDPEAIGGAVIEIGDVLVDASVRRRLEQLEEHLLNTEGATTGVDN